jgi:tetratricopeptide (TPR) repeat protein
VQLPYGTVILSRRDIREIRRTDPVRNLLFQGERLLYHEDFTLALEYLEQARERAPGSELARRKLLQGRLAYTAFLERVGRYEDAIGILRGMVEAGDGTEEVRARKGRIEAIRAAYRPRLRQAEALLAKGNPREACRHLTSLWETYPERRGEVGKPLATAEIILGDRAARTGSFAVASRHYEQALTYHPDGFPHVVARYTYAQAHVARGLLAAEKADEAATILKRALTFCPESDALHYYMGKALEEQGRIHEALEHYDRIAGDPAGPFDPAQALARHGERARSERFAKPDATRPSRSEQLLTVKAKQCHVHVSDKETGRRVADALAFHFAALAPRFKVTTFACPCDVYLYPTQHDFQTRTGATDWTPAFSTWDLRLGRLRKHEIKTYQDCPQLLASVLPHELTHLLLAARLEYRRTIPLWAAEGLAVYSEPAFKHRYYDRILSLAVRQRRLMPLKALLATTAYPDREELDLFYAQCLSLTRYLIRRTSYARFLSFLEAACTSDDWRVWRRYFRFQSPSELENHWKRAALIEEETE